MAALTIDGVDYEVRIDGARRLKPRRVGAETEAFSGKLRRTVSKEMHSWQFPIAPLSIAQLTTLTNAAKSGFKTVSGDLIGSSILCAIELEEAIPDQEDDGTSDMGAIYWLTSVTIKQAE